MLNLELYFTLIDNRVEDDCEDGGAEYYLKYEKGKIIFTRVTSYYTGDYDDYGYGLVEVMKDYKQIIGEENATAKDYANLIIEYLNYSRKPHNIYFMPIADGGIENETF